VGIAGASAYVRRAPRHRLVLPAAGAVVVLGGIAWLAVHLARSQAPRPVWHQATTADGAASALFPAPPRTESREVATPAGRLRVDFLIAETADSAYLLSATDYPAAVLAAGPDILLDGARDGAAQEIGGTLEREIPIGLTGGHPGRQLTFEIPERNSEATLRCYLVGRRLYQILQVGDRGADPEIRDRFLASFRLEGRVAAAP
jgi:hypothetical protein